MFCNEKFLFRDKTPALIYPKPDLKLLEVMYSGGSKERRRSFLRRAFDLFTYRIKSFGLVPALTMIPRYLLSRIYNKFLLVFSNVFNGNSVECQCCGWHGFSFGIFWGASKNLYNFTCPNCGSHPRHRFLANYIPTLIDIDSPGTLHFAPEEFLDNVFTKGDGVDHRMTTDIALNGVSCLSNINSLPFNDNSYSNIICIHVLEHIEDDLGAIKELYRVMKKDGVALICIPETDNEKTIEFGFEDPTKSHHWRDYGLDVKDRLSDGGFQVTTVTPKSLTVDVKRYGLSANKRFHLCKK